MAINCNEMVVADHEFWQQRPQRETKEQRRPCHFDNNWNSYKISLSTWNTARIQCRLLYTPRQPHLQPSDLLKLTAGRGLKWKIKVKQELCCRRCALHFDDRVEWIQLDSSGVNGGVSCWKRTALSNYPGAFIFLKFLFSWSFVWNESSRWNPRIWSVSMATRRRPTLKSDRVQRPRHAADDNSFPAYQGGA